ncbi:hypothetical protein [Pseudobythopirellula maris]|uniref:hypothetical protein n=1 Tax=Pseudobythopirellula maris TaxID=2527991 RepID=UPI0011B828FF|nr:hypothetical protein [Pseudobythopirellula maris]
MPKQALLLPLAWAAIVLVDGVAGGAPRADGVLEIEAVEAETLTPLPVRIELQDGRGRPVAARRWGVAVWGDHAYFPGNVTLPLRRGNYRFVIDAGPEYLTQSGHFQIDRRAEDSKRVEMRRAAHLAKEGWLAADLLASREPGGLDVARQAEQLAAAPQVGHVWSGGSWRPAKAIRRLKEEDAHHYSAARVESPGGSLTIVSRDGPFDFRSLRGDDPLAVALAAREAGLVVIADAGAWRLPAWIAEGAVDALLVLGPEESEGNRPRDRSRYPARRGLGRWREAVYHHTLGAGLRLVPLAGSGSGFEETTLGAARVYAHTGDTNSESQASPDWWDAALAGATVVTNGPLLRPKAEGRAPGAVFYLNHGETLTFEVGLSLATRDKIEYLEIIKNNEVAATVPLRDWAAGGGRLPPVEFDSAGWFAVRAVTVDADRYQMAQSAPWFVEMSGQRRVSRSSVAFFLEWLDELAADEKAAPSAERLAEAQAFWRGKLDSAEGQP